MFDLPAWSINYLNRLGLEAKPANFSFLTEICRAHLATLPFENISKLIYYRDRAKNGFIIPPVEVLAQHFFRYDFGGTCYTVNSRLLMLLRSLGFTCSLVEVGQDHMAILVQLPELDGEQVYVDCGAAAPFFKPVRFETDPENLSEFGIEQVRLVRDQETPFLYHFMRYRRNELVSENWSFYSNQPREFADFHEVIEKANQPGSFFLSSLRCQLWQPEQNRSISLVNNTLTIRRMDGTEQKELLSSLEEIEEALAVEFRLPKLPLREAVAVLNELGVDIFQEPKRAR